MTILVSECEFNNVCVCVSRRPVGLCCVSGRYAMVCVSLYLEVALAAVLPMFMSVVSDVTLDLMALHACL